MMRCGNKADWKCVRVVLGMDEADCDIAGNLYCHHIYGFRNLVVALAVTITNSQFVEGRPHQRQGTISRYPSCLIS